MADARRGEFSVLMVAAFDRIARSTKNFLEIVDELHELGIEFVSAREAIDTSGPDGAHVLDHGWRASPNWRGVLHRGAHQSRYATSERWKVRGWGVLRSDIDHDALVRDRLAGLSLTCVAKKYGVSRASVVRFVREAGRQAVAA